MPMTTVNGQPLLTPEQVAELLVVPVTAAAVATTAATPVTISTNEWRAPRVTADPSAAWVLEGAEIPASDAALDEIEVVPRKLAGLSVITRELADDSSPEAASAVGEGLARDIVRKLDDAWLRTLPAPAPPGLSSVEATELSAGASFEDLDVFVDALSAAEDHGAVLTSWVTSPAVARALAKLKKGAGSAESLLATDPTSPAQRVVAGLPLLVSPSVEPGVVWGVPRARSFVIIRDDVRLDRDESAFFTSDRVAVRATMRVAFGFTHEPSVVRISTED